MTSGPACGRRTANASCSPRAERATGVFDLYQRSAAGAATAELLWQSDESKSPSGFSPDGRILLVDRWMSCGSVGHVGASDDRRP